jgi:CubicO group peptidase (beta-lactamase class C family)
MLPYYFRRMNRYYFAVSVILSAALVSAQPLDARASDPVAMGWMVGTPPPADKTIRFADGSFYSFPQTRWSFSHLREFVPTRVVARGNLSPSEIPRAERTEIDGITFQPMGSQKTMTWAQSLEANYTDGILVLHQGRIVYERYFGILKPEGQHIAFSVSKSFVATIAASLIAEGILDDHATVGKYVPELKTSGFGDATIRQLLDMTTGLKYSEDYEDAHSPIVAFSIANGFLPRPAGYQGPAASYAYLATLAKEYPHGERFSYKTVNTDALAWVISRVTKKSLSELLRERLWSRLGVEQDAYFTVDPVGTEFAGGGFNLTLRDMARFGEMMRLGGRYHGQQIVPATVIEDIRRGGDRELFAKAGYRTLPGWSYRNMWWVSHNSDGAFSARGVHGQLVYIDPKAEMVIVRFASHPMSANANLDPTSLPAYEALARHLMVTAPRASR